ncbi:MAG TPA: DUF1003 domain-containing protein [Thermoanaerobaculia bacterium]|nr:DUF1003 domain-containing protein [Thermoanaerobaculia bacterium]
MKRGNHRGQCSVCGQSRDLIPFELVRSPSRELILKEHPDLAADAQICRADLNRYLARAVQTILEEEKGELSSLEREVVEDLSEQDITSRDVNLEFDRQLSFGERLADRIATFGGSWTFILSFGGVLLVWIVVNTALLASRAFDPYPFILLNLVLSCLAALQAPVIMMSQNRQEAKDRLRAEHDYRINLKAELEVRLLSERVDRLLTHQWQRLLEIQEIQTELMEQLGERANRRPGKPSPKGDA